MTTGTSPTTEPPTRPPPRIIRIPPPALKPQRLWTKLAPFIPSLMMLAALVIVSTRYFERAIVLAMLACVILFAVVGVVLLRLERRMRHKYQRRRESWLAANRDWASDPIAIHVASRWTDPCDPPAVFELDVEDGASKLWEARQQAAIVICLGVCDVPDVGAARFEPEIITPARRWSQLVTTAAIAALCGTYVFARLGGYRFLEDTASGLGIPGCVFVGGALFALAVAWKTLLRPAYVRFSPGMIEFLRYGLFRSRPKVTAYPVTSGTVFLVAYPVGSRGSTVVLQAKRGTDFQHVSMSTRWDSGRTIERMWQALLSTAPTPPLSDEELVG